MDSAAEKKRRSSYPANDEKAVGRGFKSHRARFHFDMELEYGESIPLAGKACQADANLVFRKILRNYHFSVRRFLFPPIPGSWNRGKSRGFVVILPVRNDSEKEE